MSADVDLVDIWRHASLSVDNRSRGVLQSSLVSKKQPCDWAPPAHVAGNKVASVLTRQSRTVVAPLASHAAPKSGPLSLTQRLVALRLLGLRSR